MSFIRTIEYNNMQKKNGSMNEKFSCLLLAFLKFLVPWIRLKKMCIIRLNAVLIDDTLLSVRLRAIHNFYSNYATSPNRYTIWINKYIKKTLLHKLELDIHFRSKKLLQKKRMNKKKTLLYDWYIPRHAQNLK